MKKLIIPPVFVLLCLAGILLAYFLLPEFLLIPFPYNLGGLVIAFPGFVIMGKSRDLLKKHQTTFNIEHSSSLITEGIFSRTRNPMYVGMFLLLTGISVCFGNLFSLLMPCLFLLSVQLVFIPKEERLLTEAFGQTYLDYKKQVRPWI